MKCEKITTTEIVREIIFHVGNITEHIFKTILFVLYYYYFSLPVFFEGLCAFANFAAVFNAIFLLTDVNE